MITFMHRALICTTTVVESTRIKISDSKLRNIKIKKDFFVACSKKGRAEIGFFYFCSSALFVV